MFAVCHKHHSVCLNNIIMKYLIFLVKKRILGIIIIIINTFLYGIFTKLNLVGKLWRSLFIFLHNMILWADIIMGFSSPCIGTPGGFGQGGAMGGSSANISSRILIPRILFYSQTPLYGHPLNMDILLLWTVCFVPREKKLLLFFKFNPHNKDTPLIRTLSVAPF